MSASTYFSSSPAISLPRSFLPMRRRGGLASGIFTNDASGGASAIILLPDETLQQAKNTAASALFASNIYFYTQFDYFDASSEFNALLHTWSLSVEEQFYIFFPPLLAFVHRRFPAALKPLVGFILVITLILSQWRLATDPSAAFYLVQYRTWELMIGSVLALGMIPESRGGVVADVVGAIGLGCIGASALLLTKISSFPGINAAPACIGAACLIWSGSARRTLAGRLLSIPPPAFSARFLILCTFGTGRFGSWAIRCTNRGTVLVGWSTSRSRS